MKILVLNSGSSSIKYRLFDMNAKTVLASGLIEQIGEPQSRLTHKTRNERGKMDEIVKTETVADHLAGFQLMDNTLRESGALRNT